MNSVLIIDDTAAIVDRLLEMLADSPHVGEVGVARTVKEGFEKVGKLNPSVIILDLRLPDGRGADLLELLRRNDFKGKIIIFSTFDSKFHRDSFLKHGADFSMDKNEDMQEIDDVIFNIFSKN